MKKIFIYIIIVIFITIVSLLTWKIKNSLAPNIDNQIDKTNLIKVDSPLPNTTITSPLIITGKARGNWFFEGSFPIMLTDWDGLIIAEGYATAEGEWMTTDFVPFKATLNFTVDKDVYSNRGTLILKKDNASGLPQHDDALEIPIIFEIDATQTSNYKNIPYIIDGQNVKLDENSTTRYFGNEIRKDLNSDGKEDIAFLITQNTGGSGTFFYVVAAINNGSSYSGSQAFLIGDRIAPQTTESGPLNSIIINYADRRPEESMTTKPSIGKSLRLNLDPETMKFNEII